VAEGRGPGRPAVFLDRDGTITPELAQFGEEMWREFGSSPEKLRLLPGAASAIREFNQAGFAVVLITNQSGVARGLFTEQEVGSVNSMLERMLARFDAHLDAIYYCPHHPEGCIPKYRKTCTCRKPAPGLFRRAARDLNLDLARSFAVGDNLRDLAPAHDLGCRTVLVLTGLGKSMIKASWGVADEVVKDIRAAAKWIIESAGAD
jgi:D-glycero-D-manno-heptose 1,7-bisphosphate phosphatase